MDEASKLEGEALDEAVAKALGDEKPWGLRFGQDHPNRSMRRGHLVGTFTREEAFARVAQGFEPHLFKRYSTEWRDGGPIIERERIKLAPNPYGASSPHRGVSWYATLDDSAGEGRGDTALVAAMRAFVASKQRSIT
jgi:hypothetical protein